MCGGAIISDLIQPSRSSRRLTADLLWGSGADLIDAKKNNNKRNSSNGNGYYSKPARSGIVDLDDESEADFDVEVLEDVKPLAFSSAKRIISRL